MDTDKLMDRIRKLQAKADSSADLGLTEEAAAFAGKVQEMLLEHKLTMSDVMFHALDEDDPISKYHFDFSTENCRETKSRLAWRETLLMAVCEAHFCQPFIGSRWKSGPTKKTTGSFTYYTIVGRKSDQEVCAYMLAYLINTAELSAKREHRKQRKSGNPTRGFKISFYDAFARTVANRYYAKIQEIKNEGFAGVSSSVAMVRLDQTKLQVSQWVSDNMGRTHYAKGPAQRKNRNFDGHTAGREAGTKVDLERRGMGKGGLTKELS